MSCYCINPFCDRRQNPDDVGNCLCCGTSLLINDRIRLVKPLRALTDDPFTYIEVFEVDDAGTEWNPIRKWRVMKVLRWDTPKLVKLIEQESLALQLIQHPNIPESTVDDFFTFVPNNSRLTLHCLIMDKIEGHNLEQWIESNGRISQPLALEWLKQLVEILDVVHHSDFFHRDIKPSNIILQPNGQLALVDFGTARRLTNTYLAKVSGSGGTNTGRGGRYEITAVVSSRYTPLEQIEGQAVPQSDFFALGRTFVQLVTGTQLIDLPKEQQTGKLIWRDKAPQIDNPFADFIEELMAPLPVQRPQTTRLILQRLEKLPQQIKTYKLTNSQIFKYSKYALMGLVVVGGVFLSIPLAANYLVTQGQKLETANNSQGAQELFNWALKISPRSNRTISSFYFDKGSRNLDNPQLAKKYYELAVKYNDKDASVYNNLAAMCQLLGDISCVKNSYEKQFTLEPNNWEGHYGLGNFYESQGKYDLAQNEYQIAMQKSEQAIPAIAALSRLKNKNKDYNAAIYLATKGLRKTQNRELQASLYKDLGWASFRQKKLNLAQQYLEKATNLDPERTDAFCLQSQVEEALNKKDDARISLEVCMLGKSSLPEVFMWRQELLDRILKK